MSKIIPQNIFIGMNYAFIKNPDLNSLINYNIVHEIVANWVEKLIKKMKCRNAGTKAKIILSAGLNWVLEENYEIINNNFGLKSVHMQL